jgi:hypothetical protein
MVRLRVLMLVAVIQVGIVRMLLQKPRVPVAMGLPGRIGRRMVVAVDVMHMAMLMLKWLIEVLVVVHTSERCR